jgi:hypothetical protein
MTFQSTPYKSWIFPDEAYHMNEKGIGQLKPVSLRNGFDLIPGGGSEAQEYFDSHDRRVALERVKMNKRKEEGMLGRLNTTVRSQRYDRPASRSAVPNGVFHGSPMDYTTSAGLRGGVITTKEGQEWLAKRLKQRIQEYDALASGDFSKGPPARIELSPYNDVDTLLQIVFTNFSSGSFTGTTNENLNRLLQAFIKIGAVITPRQLTMYTQAVQKMIQATRPYTGTELGEELGLAFENREKRLRSVDAINTTLKIIEATLREIARVIDEPQTTREQVMATLQTRLLGRQIEQFVPGYADEYRRAAIEGIPPRGPTLPGQSEDILPIPRPPPFPYEDGAPEEEYGTFQEAPAPSGQGKLRRMRRF